MRPRRIREAIGAALLTLVGALAVAGTMPRLTLAGGLPACITESPGSAWLGVQLRLLAHSADCPEGAFAPGAYYAEVAQFSIVLSLSTLVAGLVALVGALGGWFWARRALRAAKAWIGHRLGLGLVPTAVAVVWRRPESPGVRADLRSSVLARSQHRRGPPAWVLA